MLPNLLPYQLKMQDLCMSIGLAFFLCSKEYKTFLLFFSVIFKTTKGVDLMAISLVYPVVGRLSYHRGSQGKHQKH